MNKIDYRSCTKYEDVVIDEMIFRVFTTIDSSGVSAFIINLTKEKLEVELLKRKLSENKI